MRLRVLHRGWLPLALLAALLLALVPTLGRLAQAASAARAIPVTQPAIVALCTIQGMKQVALPVLAAAATHAHLRHDAPAPMPHHPQGDAGQDCDYCPLLASLTALAAIALGLWPRPASALSMAPRAAIRVARRHPSGLGSRGPPACA